MTRPRLIGITGHLQHGKDTTARALAQFGYTQTAFAAALREMALAIDPTITLDGTSRDLLHELAEATGRSGASTAFTVTPLRYARVVELIGYDKAKHIPDVRRFLQRLGTEGVRGTFGGTAWVDVWARRADLALAEGTLLCVSDVRFPEEVEAVRSRGGVMWRVERTDGLFPPSGHESEKHVPTLPVDFVLRASSAEELTARVQSLLSL